jgi:hypothetical protein
MAKTLGTKKVSDMTENELRKMITNLASKPILALAEAIGDINEKVTSLADNKSLRP